MAQKQYNSSEAGKDQENHKIWEFSPVNSMLTRQSVVDQLERDTSLVETSLGEDSVVTELEKEYAAHYHTLRDSLSPVRDLSL